MSEQLRLGVDLGGTKTEAVVVALPASADAPDLQDLTDGPGLSVLARVRAPTRRDAGYDGVLDTVQEVITEVLTQAGLRTPPPIGVGMPGGITRAGLVKNSNTTCLNGRPFRQDLAQRLGRPVAFENDANCFALAEAISGAGRGGRVVFGVILGTGVGGGVVLPGPDGPRVWPGAQGIAGEWGHVVLDPAGPPCYCGRRGCIERYLSGPALEEAYAARAGEHRGLRDIAAGAGLTSDRWARAVLAEAVELLGRALATVINILDPDVIVLGGGVSNLDILYKEGPAAVARWVFNDELRTQIRRHELGDSAGVLGAALLPPAR